VVSPWRGVCAHKRQASRPQCRHRVDYRRLTSAASSHTDGEPPPRIGQPDVDELPAPASRHSVEVLLALVLPNDPGDNRHGRMECLFGLTGALVVQDALAGRPGVGLLALPLSPPPFHTSSVEQMFEVV
jgi:hypothetical protein